MNEAQGGVLVTHPVHQHAYETAEAAQRAGLLSHFVTGIYYTPRLRRVARHLPRRVDAQLRRRFHPGLDPRLVVTHSREYAVAVPLRFAAGRLGLDGRSVERWANDRFDAHVARRLPRSAELRLVHGFEGSTLQTFRAARRIGLRTVLDVASAYEEHERVRVEEGLPPAPADFARRVAGERELADLVLVPSDYVRACLVDHGVAPDRIALLPYGVDAERFTPPAEERADGVFRVLFLGAIGPAKGVGYLLQAWSELGLQDAELVLVGEVRPGARELLGRFAGTYRHVQQVPKHAVASFIQSSDVLVLPSLSDSWGLVVGEAMACGRPVVTTSSTGFPVLDGIDGFVVPPRSADALADRLGLLHREPSLRRRLGSAGRVRVERDLSWERYSERLAEIYRAALGDKDVLAVQAPEGAAW